MYECIIRRIWCKRLYCGFDRDIRDIYATTVDPVGWDPVTGLGTLVFPKMLGQALQHNGAKTTSMVVKN